MSSTRFPNIRALTPELDGWGFFLCTYKDVRQGRGGDLNHRHVSAGPDRPREGAHLQ